MPEPKGLLRPSGAVRWLACPGSVQAEEGRPEVESDAAIEGTWAHLLLERCLEQGLPPVAIQTITDDETGETHEPDQDMRSAVSVALNYLWSKECEVYSETTVDASSLMGLEPETVAGTADAILFPEPGVLEIADYKHGRGHFVPVENNPQLLIYAAGAYVLFDSEEIHTIRTTIIQPRCPRAGQKLIRSHDYPLEAFLARVEDIGTGARIALSGVGARVPGEEQCLWCQAKGDCAERLKEVRVATEALFGPLEGYVAPDSITNEQIADFLDLIPRLKATISDIESEALRRQLSGNFIPGRKITHGRPSYAWDDPEAAEKTLRGMKVAGHKLPVDVVAPRKIISPAQARKLPGFTPRQKETLESLIVKNEGKLILVPQSDPRAAVDPNPDLKFGPTE